MAEIRIERASDKLKEHKPNPNRRENIGGLLGHIAKFAIDSTINFSLKALPGRKQVYQIVQEGLKDQPPSVSPNDNKKPEDLKLAMKDMHAKMENMQEDTNIVKQQHNISAEHVMGSADPKKMPDERGIQGSDLLQNNKKKIFIRSRL
ncbi:unnamed protein product [Prunus armeniaca]|uniref:Uncharacterized protein n=1 Tax=Prunus armeniaca TaxID=36596 RepID=A0A6J5UM85_PRUAR|nr:unnamed protein product [Prunus armeniaca]